MVPTGARVMCDCRRRLSVSGQALLLAWIAGGVAVGYLTRLLAASGQSIWLCSAEAAAISGAIFMALGRADRWYIRRLAQRHVDEHLTR